MFSVRHLPPSRINRKPALFVELRKLKRSMPRSTITAVSTEELSFVNSQVPSRTGMSTIVASPWIVVVVFTDPENSPKWYLHVKPVPGGAMTFNLRELSFLNVEHPTANENTATAAAIVLARFIFRDMVEQGSNLHNAKYTGGA